MSCKGSSCRCRVKVVDGGFATQLSQHVDEPVDGNPLWSARFLATHPEAIVQTHLDFLRAGANIIITNTYQASVDGFMKYLGLSENESIELIEKAVKLAKKAVDTFMSEQNGLAERPLIAGSVGPYGASLHDYSEYSGDYADRVTRRQLAEWHRPRMAALLRAGADLLAVETIPAQAEAEAVADLLRDFPAARAWIAFSCKDGERISHGERFCEAARSCWERNPRQLLAVGVNCLKPRFVAPLVASLNDGRDACPIPVVAYPNSGENFDTQLGAWVDGDNCKPVETYVRDWLSLGVRYVGGCCRTTDQDVSRIRAEVKKWQAGRAATGTAANGHA
ncbi:homocysteine S-methyltransferase YbgG-like [Schistocerca piceifrons]|uniref:homocysteine S-methyltransferase YbgG-like n=1 Tax=Schistocerca piceifrons TaxID=274613 RepID=UPI001F5E3F6B|nr:homocysteine S-methyltransferase YbgG-like [Schistocerca piceifrons]